MAVFKVLYPCAVVEGDVVKQVTSGTVELTDAVAKPLVESIRIAHRLRRREFLKALK